jgi:hypothetical protein
VGVGSGFGGSGGVWAGQEARVQPVEKLPLERLLNVGGAVNARRPKSRHRDFEHIMETYPEYEKGLLESEKVGTRSAYACISRLHGADALFV